jgi:hypothetical protein
MSRTAIAIAYHTNEHGVRDWHALTKDENWFWRNMRKRVKAGLLANTDTCIVVRLATPTPVKTVNRWTAEQRQQFAHDPYYKEQPASVRVKPKMDTLLAEIAERKLISELANLAKPVEAAL